MLRFLHWLSLLTLTYALFGCNTAPIYERLAPTDKKILVQEVQRELIERGFDPGPADGVAGVKTLDALREFQKARGLPITDGVNAVAYGQVYSDTEHLREKQKKSNTTWTLGGALGSRGETNLAYNDSRVEISNKCSGLFVPKVFRKKVEGVIPVYVMHVYNQSQNRYSVTYDVTFSEEKRNVLGNFDSTYTREKTMTVRAGDLVEVTLIQVNQGRGAKISDVSKIDVFSCTKTSG